jgi:two-component sensor histidine kinase
VSMIVSDDEVGLPPSLDSKTTKSLGMKLIDVLTTQLEGQLTIESPPGPSFTVRFTKRKLDTAP